MRIDDIFYGSKKLKLDRGRVYLGKFINVSDNQELYLKINGKIIEVKKEILDNEFEKYYKTVVKKRRFIIPKELREIIGIGKYSKAIYEGKGNYFILKFY